MQDWCQTCCVTKYFYFEGDPPVAPPSKVPTTEEKVKKKAPGRSEWRCPDCDGPPNHNLKSMDAWCAVCEKRFIWCWKCERCVNDHPPQSHEWIKEPEAVTSAAGHHWVHRDDESKLPGSRYHHYRCLRCGGAHMEMRCIGKKNLESPHFMKEEWEAWLEERKTPSSSKKPDGEEKMWVSTVTTLRSEEVKKKRKTLNPKPSRRKTPTKRRKR